MQAFWSVKDAGVVPKCQWDIAVSGCFNFYPRSTNSTSYKSWHLQLKFETSVRSLKLVVWPQEVSEVTKVKIKKILGENSKIVSFWPGKMLYTSEVFFKKSSFIYEIKLEVFVKVKLNKNIFFDFWSPKMLIFYRSWLNFWKACQDSQNMTLLPSRLHVYR